jgi:hypothetical protein
MICVAESGGPLHNGQCPLDAGPRVPMYGLFILAAVFAVYIPPHRARIALVM